MDGQVKSFLERAGDKLKHGDKKKKHSHSTITFLYCCSKDLVLQLEKHSSLKMKHQYDTEYMVTRRAMQALGNH